VAPDSWVVLEGVKIVFCEEILHFFGIFVSVYDYDNFAFVGSDNRCLLRYRFVFLWLLYCVLVFSDLLCFDCLSWRFVAFF